MKEYLEPFVLLMAFVAGLLFFEAPMTAFLYGILYSVVVILWAASVMEDKDNDNS